MYVCMYVYTHTHTHTHTVSHKRTPPVVLEEVGRARGAPQKEKKMSKASWDSS